MAADGNHFTFVPDESGKPAFVVMPIGKFMEITGKTEAELDALAFARAADEDDGFRLPHAQASRLVDGESIVKVLREWRNLDQATLAKRCGTTPNYLSQIETGARKGVRMAAVLASALDVPVDALKAYL